MAMQRLKEAAEKAKIELSGVQQTQINLPFITADSTGPKHLDVTLTRAKFEELIHDLVESTAGPVNQALKDAGLTPNDIHKVLLVGGSTRVPAVLEAVKRIPGKGFYLLDINGKEHSLIKLYKSAKVVGNMYENPELFDTYRISVQEGAQ